MALGFNRVIVANTPYDISTSRIVVEAGATKETVGEGATLRTTIQNGADQHADARFRRKPGLIESVEPQQDRKRACVRTPLVRPRPRAHHAPRHHPT